jgi:hypothetical protein
MKIFRHLLLFALFYCVPSAIFAQGVPKAFAPIYYQGKVYGNSIRFKLADGYIGASIIRMKLNKKGHALIFQPESGTADEHNQLKFLPFPKSNSGYFILDNMQEAYEDTPLHIKGYYFFHDKKILLKLIKK